MESNALTAMPSRPDAPATSPDPDLLLELHRELWAAQHRQAAAAPGSRQRADADSAVAWFEWLLVDYLQRAARRPRSGRRRAA